MLDFNRIHSVVSQNLRKHENVTGVWITSRNARRLAKIWQGEEIEGLNALETLLFPGSPDRARSLQLDRIQLVTVEVASTDRFDVGVAAGSPTSNRVYRFFSDGEELVYHKDALDASEFVGI